MNIDELNNLIEQFLKEAGFSELSEINSFHMLCFGQCF